MIQTPCVTAGKKCVGLHTSMQTRLCYRLCSQKMKSPVAEKNRNHMNFLQLLSLESIFSWNFTNFQTFRGCSEYCMCKVYWIRLSDMQCWNSSWLTKIRKLFDGTPQFQLVYCLKMIQNCTKAIVHLPYFVNKSFLLKIRNECMRLRCFDQVTINIVNNALVVA